MSLLADGSSAGGAAVLAGLLAGAALFVVLPPGPRSLGRQVRPARTMAPSPSTFWPSRFWPSKFWPRRSAPAGVVPAAVAADLVAALLSSGLPPASALATVETATAELGLAMPPGMDPVLDAIALAEATGLAPAGLVRAAATEQRRRESAVAEVAARRLAVLVVLPMGLLLLPAFVLLTVAPLVIGLLGQ